MNKLSRMPEPEDARPTPGTQPHRFAVRVYFEDTDAGGIVYYANFLKYMERARTEMLRAGGVVHKDMIDRDDAMFVVRRCLIDYHRPAKLDDELQIVSRVTHLGAASLDLLQDVCCSDTVVARAEIRLACVTGSGQVCRIPAIIRGKIGFAADSE